MVEPMQALALPLTVDEVTPAWLTVALGERYPGVEVLDSAVSDVMEGSATKVRLRLTYNDAGSERALPETMVLKAGFNEMMRQLAGPLYRNEVLFFLHAAPHLAVPLPRSYYAASDEDSGQSLLLLEDLDAAGSTFGDIHVPLSPEAVRESLALLARVHAAFWDRADIPPVSELKSGADGQRAVVDFLLSEENWDRCADLGRFDTLPTRVRDRARVAAAINGVLNAPAAGPRCLVHGDAHLGNMYFDSDGGPRFLDWQAAGGSEWVADIAYFIVCAMDTDDRRTYERDLLAHYFDELRGAGAEAIPSLDEAWDGYRHQVVYGLLGLLCTPEMQSESFSRTMGTRFACAIDDLDSLVGQ